MGLGTNRLTSSADRVAFIRHAVAAGIGVIDTAHLYTGGSSEATVGEAFPGATADAVIATKGAYRPGEGRPDVVRAQIDESLRRLRTDRIPLWYLHRIDPQTPLEQTLGVVREYVEAGRIGLPRYLRRRRRAGRTGARNCAHCGGPERVQPLRAKL